MGSCGTEPTHTITKPTNRRFHCCFCWPRHKLKVNCGVGRLMRCLLLKQGRRGACSVRSCIWCGELLDPLRYVYMVCVCLGTCLLRWVMMVMMRALPLMFVCVCCFNTQLPVAWQNSRTLGVSRTISPSFWNDLFVCVNLGFSEPQLFYFSWFVVVEVQFDWLVRGAGDKSYVLFRGGYRVWT